LKTLPIDLPIADVEQLCRKSGIRWLALFGSVLRSDFHPESDVDVLVEFKPGCTPGLEFFTLEQKLSDLLGRTVDLHTPRTLHASFREKVLAEAETVYGVPE
jgi:predicted nucleotidyltransferase